MLAVEDYIFALEWARRLGGLPALIARADANAAAVDAWVERTDWIEHLAARSGDPLEHQRLPQIRRRRAARARRGGAGALWSRKMAGSARGGRRGLRRRQLSRRAAGPAHLVRRDGRDRRSRGAVALARLGLPRGPRSSLTAKPRPFILVPAFAGDEVQMPKVLISDPMDPKAAEMFRANGVEVDEKPGLSKDELKAIIGDYDGLAIRSATKVTADLLDAATRLKVIGRAGIGVDNVDIPAATARGVVVMNTPFGNSITTAEHAIALMFALARDLPAADASTQAGKWEKNRFMGVELTSKTLGLIGAGNIGSIVADRALGLRMKVVAYDPFLTPERALDLGVEKVDARRAARPRRLHHPAHAADRPDPQHPLARESGEDQEGRADHQLRARRADRRGGAQGGAGERPRRRRRARRVRRRAGQGQSPVRHARPGRDAASRRLDHRGAGQRRHPGRRADVGVPDPRRRRPTRSTCPRSPPRRRRGCRPYMALAEKLGSLVGQLEGRRASAHLDRGRGRRGAAQPEADHRRGAGRA